MRLLLDEHFSTTIAARLRDSGHDVIAVGGSGVLRGLSDDQLLRWARHENRALVTENVGDFVALHRALLRRGEVHSGILFTSPRKFTRSAAGIGRLIAALAAFLDDHPSDDALSGDVAWL